MTDDQREKLQRLARCRLLPGSWDKRFITRLASVPEPVELTDKQVDALEKLWHRYRKQLAAIKG